MNNLFRRVSVIVFSLIMLTCCASCEQRSTKTIKMDKLVDIGTHKLHVVLADVPQARYTIILEAGGGKYSDSYQKIQDTLAMLTGCRVLSYDRSGYGRSELGPDNFTALDEVHKLKKCLEVQGFNDHYILVGLSWGGYLVQLFTKQYPELVEGLVLIDPMNAKFVKRFGLDKLNAITPYFKNPTQNYEKAGNRMVDNARISFGMLSGYELPTDLPVILLTSGNAPIDPEIWRRCHEEMVMYSPKHKLIIAEGNGHDIVEENPGLVLETIIELVNTIKSESE